MEIGKYFCVISGRAEAKRVAEIIKTLSTDFFLPFPNLSFPFLPTPHFNSALLHIDKVKTCKHLFIAFLPTVFQPLPKQFLFGFKTFAVFRMQSVFFWEFPRRLKFKSRRFGTQCRFHRPGRSGRWNRH